MFDKDRPSFSRTSKAPCLQDFLPLISAQSGQLQRTNGGYSLFQASKASGPLPARQQQTALVFSLAHLPDKLAIRLVDGAVIPGPLAALGNSFEVIQDN